MTDFPFGDPCPCCCASATASHVDDQVCECKPCPTCRKPTGSLCGHCGESLGCRDHRQAVEEHVFSGGCSANGIGRIGRKP